MPEDEEELLKAIYGVVDKLKGDVYYALVYAVLDRVLKPLGADKDDIKDVQRSIDEILGVAREAIKVERSFMIMIPYSNMGFIRFDLPATKRGSLRRRSTWTQQRCKYPPFQNSVNIYLLNWDMYNKVMKLLYKAEQEELFYVSTPSFYIPTPRIQVRCETAERTLPRPPLDRTRDKRPRED